MAKPTLLLDAHLKALRLPTVAPQGSWTVV